MPTEELAVKILFLLQRTPQGKFSPHNLENEIYNAFGDTYPTNTWEAVGQAIREALSWLIAQGLIVPAKDCLGSNTWMCLSRRASSFSSEADFDAFQQARRLDRDNLHEKIAVPVWQAFVRGEYDVAVFQAMKAVEVAVREASGITDALGVKLMRQAFHPKDGPLTDLTVEDGEREARMNLFVGAMGSYKNPQSHRDVNLSEPQEAIEIIMLANHLLRIVDRHR